MVDELVHRINRVFFPARKSPVMCVVHHPDRKEVVVVCRCCFTRATYRETIPYEKIRMPSLQRKILNVSDKFRAEHPKWAELPPDDKEQK